MRIVFFGSGAFGLPTLARLSREHQVVAVVTQPDKPAGRGGRLSPTPIGAWAAECLPDVPLLKPEKVNLPHVVQAVRGVPADAWVVIAFGQKLSKPLLADRFAINLHASLLPRWRGAAPINAAILAGDPVTGNSVITLADRMDAGLVLGTSIRPIDPLSTAGELHDALAADGPDLVMRVLADHAAGVLQPQTQDESQVTIATKLSKDNDDIDFHQPADFLRREVHALTPWPGISVVLTNPNAAPPAAPVALKLLRVRAEDGRSNADPGTLIDPRRGLVSCGHGTVLALLEVQPPGKRAMPWSDFANGRTLLPSTMVASARQDA
ncbi:MAG: methionyl-tRNA formyltransferase [Phycisphaerales bacterium]|nr:methionyl-tRNA formyltransferase [Phycisphaerales bacterium]